MIAASSHVLSSISRGGTQWVYGGRLFVASARTNKMHHRKLVELGAIFAANFDFFSENSFSPPWADNNSIHGAPNAWVVNSGAIFCSKIKKTLHYSLLAWPKKPLVTGTAVINNNLIRPPSFLPGATNFAARLTRFWFPKGPPKNRPFGYLICSLGTNVRGRVRAWSVNGCLLFSLIQCSGYTLLIYIERFLM